MTVDIKRPHLDDEEGNRESLFRTEAAYGVCDHRFSDTGMRVKIMRHGSMGPRFKYRKFGKEMQGPLFDFGIGVSFDVDTARLEPKARLRIRNVVSLTAVPNLGVKVQKRFPISNTPYAIRCSYTCPFDEIHQFYKPPARLLVTLDNTQDYGVKVSQAGIEAAANTWLFGDRAHVQAAALVRLPNAIPLKSDEEIIRIEPRRCGLKMLW